MAALDREDRNWIIEQLGGVHEQIGQLRTDLALNRQEIMSHITSDSCRKIRTHEEKRHSFGRAIVTIGGTIGATLGGVQLLRMIFNS